MFPQICKYRIIISIHALREEGDRDLYRFIADFGVFLSTPSARRATRSPLCHEVHKTISIHALREEGDRETATAKPTEAGISIHALREEGDPIRCCIPSA